MAESSASEGIRMKVKIEWQEPIQLTKHKTIIVEEKHLLESSTQKPASIVIDTRWKAHANEPVDDGDEIDEAARHGNR